MMAAPDLAIFRSEVLDAFGSASRPPKFLIAPHDCDECRQVCADFASIEWIAAPDATIESHPSALSLMSPEAYAYFLPAYLLYAVAHFTHDALPSEMTVYSLAFSEPSGEGMHEWHRGRLKFVTAAQLETLERFLILVENDATFSEYIGKEEIADGRARLRELWNARWTV
jgi:hypothetical protein